MHKVASPDHVYRELQQILAYTHMSNPSRSLVASRLRDLASQLEVTASLSGTPLYGYDSEDNAYLVDDYPYGRRLRCRIRYWIEYTSSKGYRFCSQTEDPRTLRWNKPKKSTYVDLAACMYLDSRKYVQWKGLGRYDDGAKALEFVKDFPRADFRALKVYVPMKIKYLEEYSEGRAYFTINGVRQEASEDDIGRAKKELEDWQDVLRLI